jgi:hypothetical protein
MEYQLKKKTKKKKKTEGIISIHMQSLAKSKPSPQTSSPPLPTGVQG